MGLSGIFSITGTALNAQSIHIDVIAKNMANSQVVSSTEAGAYRARRPIFSTLMASGFASPMFAGDRNAGIRIDGFTDSTSTIERQRMPGNPLADEEGYVYLSNVNIVEEMAYMMQASRTYQSNIEVLNTSKQLILRTLSLGA